MLPIELILNNLPEVVAAFNEVNHNKKAAYDVLVAHGSDVANIPFNTFKTIAPAMVATSNHLKPQIDLLETALDAVLIGYETLANTQIPATVINEASDMNSTNCTNESVLNSTYSTNDTVLTSTNDSVLNCTNEITIDAIVEIVRREIANLVPSMLPNISPATPLMNTNESMDTGNRYPTNYNGWSLSRGRDGFIRMNKGINGKVNSIYIGKNWDANKATLKIAQWEQTHNAIIETESLI
jgi:hypothetical protein